MNEEYFVEENFLSPEELVDKQTKTRNLNSIKFKIDKILETNTNSYVTTKLNSMKLLLEDAYKIDMYKFQFKVFILTLNKEVKNIEDYIAAGNI